MIDKEPSVKDMAALWNACENFIEKHEIICAESIYQSDRIMINAPELVEDVCNIVGYIDCEDDE